MQIEYNQQLSLFPIHILVNISSFLTLKEIVRLREINKAFQVAIKSGIECSLLYQRLPQFYIMMIRQNLNVKNLLPRLERLDELKMWGFKSTGGIPQKIVSHWVHKAFMVNENPIVIFPTQSPPFYFDGCIRGLIEEYAIMIRDISQTISRITKQYPRNPNNPNFVFVYQGILVIRSGENFRDNPFYEQYQEEYLQLMEFTHQEIRPKIKQSKAKIPQTLVPDFGAIRRINVLINDICTSKPSVMMIFSVRDWRVKKKSFTTLLQTQEDIASYTYNFQNKIISYTNIQDLRGYSECFVPNQVKYVIFKQTDVVCPLAWIEFPSAINEFRFQLAQNFWHIVQGTRVYILKLQRSEGLNVVQGTGLSYVSYSGPKLPLN